MRSPKRAHINGVLKPNGAFQNLPSSIVHNLTAAHLSRLDRPLPPGMNESDINPPTWRPSVLCMPCCLTQDGEPRAHQPCFLMDLRAVPDHVATPYHQEHADAADGRLAAYHAAHAGHPGPFAGEIW